MGRKDELKNPESNGPEGKRKGNEWKVKVDKEEKRDRKTMQKKGDRKLKGKS